MCNFSGIGETSSPLATFKKGLKLQTELTKARPITHKSIVSFRQLRQDVYDELAQVEQMSGVKVHGLLYININI